MPTPKYSYRVIILKARILFNRKTVGLPRFFNIFTFLHTVVSMWYASGLESLRQCLTLSDQKLKRGACRPCCRDLTGRAVGKYLKEHTYGRAAEAVTDQIYLLIRTPTLNRGSLYVMPKRS